MNTRSSLHIGINGYAQGIGALRYCCADAQALKGILDSHREGFGATSSILMCDDPAPANPNHLPTRTNIITSLKQICLNAAAEDTVLIQFSGHGALGNAGKLHLLTRDTAKNAMEETSISWEWIIKQIEASPAAKKILILDACHSGAGRDTQAGMRLSESIASEIESSCGGFVCISSCSGGELAYERAEFGQGIFTHYLTVGISGAADPLRRGIVDVDSLFTFARERTIQEAKQIGVSQRPFIITKASTPLDRFVITSIPLDRSMGRVMILSEDPVVGSLLHAAISQNGEVREASWRNDIELEITTAKERFDYSAVYVDVRENWSLCRDFILLIREKYPIVPFVLVGSRETFLSSLARPERVRFSNYFFFDLSLPVTMVSDATDGTLAQIQWDITKRYGETVAD